MEFVEEFSSLIKMLRFFVRTKNFSYIDRIGNALTYEPVEVAIKDALRDFQSIHNSAKIEDGRKVIYDKQTNKPIYLPNIPDSEEVENFLKKVKEDMSYARKLAIFALTIPQTFGGDE
ncbi:type I-A CRISPR-associated protein Csa5 [Methanocaldococcus sp. 10A]